MKINHIQNSINYNNHMNLIVFMIVLINATGLKLSLLYNDNCEK